MSDRHRPFVRLRALALLLLLLAGSGAWTLDAHAHADEGTHPGCEICWVASAAYTEGTATPDVRAELLPTSESDLPIERAVAPAANPTSHPPSRAPPSA